MKQQSGHVDTCRILSLTKKLSDVYFNNIASEHKQALILKNIHRSEDKKQRCCVKYLKSASNPGRKLNKISIPVMLHATSARAFSLNR